jgi:hypothetical protein
MEVLNFIHDSILKKLLIRITISGKIEGLRFKFKIFAEFAV